MQTLLKISIEITWVKDASKSNIEFYVVSLKYNLKALSSEE